MSTGDASKGRAARPVGDSDASPRQDEPGAPTTAAPAVDTAAASGDPAEKELLCTICGLRACWT